MDLLPHPPDDVRAVLPAMTPAPSWLLPGRAGRALPVAARLVVGPPR